MSFTRPSTNIFTGQPCRRCGNTQRYLSNNVCIHCSHKNNAVRYLRISEPFEGDLSELRNCSRGRKCKSKNPQPTAKFLCIKGILRKTCGACREAQRKYNIGVKARKGKIIEVEVDYKPSIDTAPKFYDEHAARIFDGWLASIARKVFETSK